MLCVSKIVSSKAWIHFSHSSASRAWKWMVFCSTAIVKLLPYLSESQLLWVSHSLGGSLSTFCPWTSSRGTALHCSPARPNVLPAFHHVSPGAQRPIYDGCHLESCQWQQRTCHNLPIRHYQVGTGLEKATAGKGRTEWAAAASRGHTHLASSNHPQTCFLWSPIVCGTPCHLQQHGGIWKALCWVK